MASAMDCDRRVAVRLIATILALSVGCRSETLDPAVLSERQRSIDWAVAAGAEALSVGQIVRHGLTVTAIGELSIPLAWTDYAGRMRDRVAAGYRLAIFDDWHVEFTRSTIGDIYTVTVETVSAGPPLRARITFAAAPY